MAYQATQESLNRRRQMAQALQDQAMLPIEMPQHPGAQVSPWQGISKLAAGLVAALNNRKIDKEQKALDQQMSADRTAQIAAMMQPQADLTAGLASEIPDVNRLASALLVDRQRSAESQKERDAKQAADAEQNRSSLQRLAIQLSGNRAESELDRIARAQEVQQRAEIEKAQLAQQAEQNAMNRQNQLDIANIRETPAPPQLIPGRDIPLDPAVEAQRIRMNATRASTGRPVTSGDANRVADLNTSLDDLKVLRETVTAQGDTGALAKIQAKAPNWFTEITGGWGADAKSRQAVIDRVKQVIGKALEGGVLRKEDEYKYEKILPTIGDPAKVVNTKLDGLDKAIAQRRETLLDSLGDAGYDISRYQQRNASAPSDVPSEVWAVMTPEERALWGN